MDLRKERTFKLLGEAFEVLLHEKSFETLSVSELCDRAMIRRATFYNHFSSKEDYLAFFIRSRRAFIHEEVLKEEAPKEIDEYCRAMTRRLVALTVEHRSLLVGLKLGSTRDALFGSISREIASEMGEMLLEEGYYANLNEEERISAAKSFTSFYAAGLFGVLGYALDAKKPLNEEEINSLFDRAIECVVFPNT